MFFLLHVKYHDPLSPITMYETKQEVEQYQGSRDLINITEIGEVQAMMEMVRHEYIGNLQHVSTDIVRMHMDPAFWYQLHNFDSDAHHLNNHMIIMIDMVQKYMRGNATRIETYIDLGAVVYEFKHCKGTFARSKLTMKAIRSMHADLFYLPDHTRHNASANSSNNIKILEGIINDSKQSLQTISPILSSEGTDTQCINQKAHLMSEQNRLSPDWVAGLERETVICEDVAIRLSTSLPILEGCLNVTCVQCENGKSLPN
jgi:hypothetical protein